jgi:hypothetical protein
MKGREKAFEDDDPMELVGMVIDTNSDEMMEAMGRTFADEFLRMGYPPPAIVSLFRDPFYRAPHALYKQKGELYVAEMIEQVRNSRRPR